MILVRGLKVRVLLRTLLHFIILHPCFLNFAFCTCPFVTMQSPPLEGLVKDFAFKFVKENELNTRIAIATKTQLNR